MELSALFQAPWKSKIREFGKRLLVVKSENIERLFKTKKVTSFTYDILRKSVATEPTSVQRKWNKLLPSPIEDCLYITVSLSYARVLASQEAFNIRYSIELLERMYC